MKNYKKLGIITLGMLIILPFFIVNAKCATTIGDTTFPAEVGDVYVWHFLEAYGSDFSDKINFTAEAVYQGQHASVDALIVNYSQGYYNDTTAQWTTTHDNVFYMAANETQNYFNISSTFWGYPIAYLIPTPINLSAIALTLSSHPEIDSYEVFSDRIHLYRDGGDYQYKLWFSSSGILTRWEERTNVFASVFVLETPLDGNGEDGGGAISFGHSFLIFALISIVALVYLKKKKL
ncbi:MAG: hypothetical protein ACFFBF_15130 [Promethearchaeota archaeon]